MIRDIHLMTDEDLDKRFKDIHSRCSHWASCQDGSHGLALHTAGIDEVVDEMNRRKDMLKDD